MELSRHGLERNYPGRNSLGGVVWVELSKSGQERNYPGRNNSGGIVLDGTLGWNCPGWKCQGTIGPTEIVANSQKHSIFVAYLPKNCL